MRFVFYRFLRLFQRLPDAARRRCNALRPFSSTNGKAVVKVTFVDRDGEEVTLEGHDGDNLLFFGRSHGVDMEGACEASLACTTCHVYVDQPFFNMLGTASEEEEDLLDMAPFLKSNSRLGCQIILRPELNGLRITLPQATRNFYVDGHKPEPH